MGREERKLHPRTDRSSVRRSERWLGKGAVQRSWVQLQKVFKCSKSGLSLS